MTLLPVVNNKPSLPEGRDAEHRKKEFAQKIAALRTATGKVERFITPCACALHDKPFSVVYERTDPDKRFTIARIEKPESGNGSGGPGVTASRPRTLSAHEVDETGWRCPWCGDTSTIMQCPDCATTVCGGRVKRAPGAQPVFVCRPSCGARYTMVKADTITGAEDVLRRSAAHRPAPPSTPASRPALPRPSDLPLLGRK